MLKGKKDEILHSKGIMINQPASSLQNISHQTFMETVSTFIRGTELTMAAARQQTIQTQNGGASERVCGVYVGVPALGTQHRAESRELARLTSCESYYTSSLLNGVCYGPRTREQEEKRVASRQSPG